MNDRAWMHRGDPLAVALFRDARPGCVVADAQDDGDIAPIEHRLRPKHRATENTRAPARFGIVVESFDLVASSDQRRDEDLRMATRANDVRGPISHWLFEPACP